VENLRFWDKLRTPPSAALKKIAAGRMKGKTDINPQWRIKVMTEHFGPVGIGWKYTIDRLWTEKGSGDQVCAFVLVSVYIKDGENWSEPIQGSGGSMLIAQEKSGLYTSDEAFKMATTDALSVALKAIGVAADVYMGMMDGSKYEETIPSAFNPLTQDQITVLNDEIKLRDVDLKRYLIYAGVNSLGEIDQKHFEAALSTIKQKPVKE